MAIISGAAGPALTTSFISNRTSNLEAPIMVLTGHEAEILTCQFSPDGKTIASGSADKAIHLFNVYGECENFGMLRGHKAAVLELHWDIDGSKLYTASADQTLGIWDLEEGKKIRGLRGHTEVVNSCFASIRGSRLLCSGSDDGSTKIWDMRVNRCVRTFEHPFPILAVSFDMNAERIFAASLDNIIQVFDVRKDDKLFQLTGHDDSITGISINNEGSHLVSNSMDQSIKVWDIQPFFSGSNRCLCTLHGAVHNFEKNLLRVRWSNFGSGRQFGSGSADRMVYVWEYDLQSPQTSQLKYKLPGHSGSVNEVCFHPTEPIIASCGSDKKIYLGELA